MTDKKELTLGSLFDGIGGWLLSAQRTGIKPIWSSEIEPFPLAVSKKHFPEVEQLGDVTKINGAEVTPVDIICAGSPCFTEGIMIPTNKGLLPVEEIEVGQCVLSHDGKYHKVLKTMKRETDDIYSIKAQGLIPTNVTGDHPIYVRKMKKYYPVLPNGKRGNQRKFLEPQWIKVKDLQKGDFVGYPILKEEQNPLHITEEEAWLIGRYIADGYIESNQRKDRPVGQFYYRTIFCVGLRKKDEFLNNLSSFKGSLFDKVKNSIKIRINNKRLMELCKKCNRGALNKEIPYEYLLLPNHLLKILIEGYISGDGHFYSNKNKYSALTVSKKLALSLQLAIHKVYKLPCKIYFIKKELKHIIENRIVNQHSYYEVNWLKDLPAHSRAFVDDNFIWQPFTSIEKLNSKQTVYNFEVEDTNTYVANGIAVHNCQGLSVAGKRRGLDDQRSGLFMESMRIYRQMRDATYGEYPKFFVWENVCFTGDTFITTKDGQKQLYDINIGDSVKTHTGKYQKVLNKVILKTKPIVNVRVKGIENLRTTPNHTFLVRRKIVGGKLSKPNWKEIGLCEPFRDYVGFSIDVPAKTRTLLKSETKAIGIELFQKAIPDYVFHLTVEEQCEIMKSMLSCYGYNTAKGRIILCVSTLETAYTLARFLRNVFLTGVEVEFIDTANDFNVKSYGHYEVSLNLCDDRNIEENGLYENGFLWLPIQRIVDKGEVCDVCNLTVEKDESFLADGIAVHNCGAFSSNKGMDFRAVLEEIAETDIPIPQGGKWADAGVVECPNCEIAWRVIDAQYLGVPQRRRRIFLIADFRASQRCAAEILFEFEGMQGNTPSSEGTQ